MTKDEARRRYNIPMTVLDEYESWGLCRAVKKVMGVWQYDDTDLENLSLIMTLHDIGFNGDEVETYMNLSLVKGDKDDERNWQMMQMLNAKRDVLLDEIHFKEKHLSRLDYLRHQIRQSDKQQN